MFDRKISWLLLACLLVATLAATASRISIAQTLEAELLATPVNELLAEARREGDPQRGAIVFHQAQLACAKCHPVGSDGPKTIESLGPDLARLPGDFTDADFITSILQPSAKIRKGFEATTVILQDGRTLHGVIASRSDKELVLREASRFGEPTSIPAAEIEEVRTNTTSLMPAGQMNQLSSRQQFLDLLKYLIEVRKGGPERARSLQPPASLIAFTLPEYEERLDHAGFVRDWNAESMARGEKIYQRVCANCHGTREMAGSLPTSLRFAEGKFKNGSDPLSMYRTLTRGFGLMAPQTWMVPSQKYDVIHYIRETYLKPYNRSQYVEVDSSYLAKLPTGNTRGPAPSAIDPWVAMDYGPSLIHTYEFPSSPEATRPNLAYKGIAIRLDPGPGGVSRGENWMVFDHDTLRWAGAWSADGQSIAKNRASTRAQAASTPRFIDWAGIQFDGRHGTHPRVVGDVAWTNPVGPGWGRPADGNFEDEQRVKGRDGKTYGPLPRSWGKFRGLYHHGLRTIVSYRVGDSDILESPRLIETTRPDMVEPARQSASASPPQPSQPSEPSRPQPARPQALDRLFARQFHIGPRRQPLILKVAQLDASAGELASHVQSGRLGDVTIVAPRSAMSSPAATSVSAFRFDGQSYAELTKTDAFNMHSQDFSLACRVKTKKGGTIFARVPPGTKWAPNGQSLFIRDGHVCFDIGWVGVVRARRRVDDGQWHDIVLTWQQESAKVTIFVDGQMEAEGRLAVKQALPQSTIRIGFSSPDFPQPQSSFAGEIEELRFYQRRLEPSAIARPWPEDQKVLAGLWRPREAAANELPDRSGHNHHASLQRGESPPASSPRVLVAGIAPRGVGVTWKSDRDQSLRLEIPAGDAPLNFTLWTTSFSANQMPNANGEGTNNEPLSQAPFDAEKFATQLANTLFVPEADGDLTTMTRGGPARWPQVLETQAVRGTATGPFAVDILTHPTNNPWFAQLRLTGIDFYPDGDRAAVCTWDGDVWLVSGLAGLREGESTKSTTNEKSGTAPPPSPTPAPLRWRRIATGLFQPLGLKIIADKIHLTCRDQLAVLHDLNGDLETDFYECLNNDHQVTEHFHEFAMGLQTDEAGNFYYAKSARHALPAVVPHHGTLLRVSRDGSKTDILATGFRAANGVCLNPDGTFIVTDQEGHWNPKNRINWVQGSGPDEFFGNMFGYHGITDASDLAMKQPLCWITNAFDRSPAELLWVPRAEKQLGWGPLAGSLLNLSYGYGKIFVVPHEKVAGQVQGGMCELPLPVFPTGLIRGRFHPQDGQLYTCGMFSWAGSATQPGGLYRVRYTGQPVHLPIGIAASTGRMTLTFSGPLDPASLEDVNNFAVKSWSLKRTANYGSQHHDERSLRVARASLSDDRRRVTLEIPDLAPTWCMEIKYALRSAEDAEVRGTIHNTIHKLAP